MLPIIILVLCIIFFINKSNKEHFHINKPYLWSYWENVDYEKPEYISLCFKSMIKHCGDSFNVKILNNNTIHNYIKIPEYVNNINNIAQKVDVYRLLLLYKYGGIWLDADTIVMKDLSPVINKLQNYDLIASGCTGKICQTGKPSNGFLVANKKSIILKRAIRLCLKKIKHDKIKNYFSLGKLVLWKVIKKYQDKFYHYESSYVASRDIHGKWISPRRQLKNRHIPVKNNMFCITLYNSNYPRYFKSLTSQDILNMDNFIGKYFRKSLLD